MGEKEGGVGWGDRHASLTAPLPRLWRCTGRFALLVSVFFFFLVGWVGDSVLYVRASYADVC